MEKYKQYLIEKSNTLNTAIVNYEDFPVTINEVRLIKLYLSRINARNISTRRVKFTIKEFCQAAGIKRMDLKTFGKAADIVMKRLVTLPNGNKGFLRTGLFVIYWNDKQSLDEGIEMECTDLVIPYMFNLKEQGYFQYTDDMIAKLDSVSSSRLYELIKQHYCKETFYTGEKKLPISIEFDLEYLFQQLYIPKEKYKERIDNFKERVLNPAIAKINDETDIHIMYKKGKNHPHSRKWKSIIFIIDKNPNYCYQLTFDSLISPQATTVEDDGFPKALQNKGVRFTRTQCLMIENIFLSHFSEDSYTDVITKGFCYTLELYNFIRVKAEFGDVVFKDYKSFDESRYLFSYFRQALKNNLAPYKYIKDLPYTL